jgi:hypothetical protein
MLEKATMKSIHTDCRPGPGHVVPTFKNGNSCTRLVVLTRDPLSERKRCERIRFEAGQMKLRDEEARGWSGGEIGGRAAEVGSYCRR